MAKRAIVSTVVVVCAAVALFFGLSSHAGRAGRAAPALPAASLANGRTSVDALTAGGSRAIVIFFASWCGPCREEAHAVGEFGRGAGRGHIAMVDYSGDPGGEAFVHAEHWTMPVLADPEGRAGEAWGFRGLPAVFVIGPSGRIVASKEGPQSVASLEAALRG
jgi:thiol-disulfide isomerase/thioredoxin